MTTDAINHSVGVMIPTFRRPGQLGDALTHLHETSVRAPRGWGLGVVVIDDDPSGSAAAVVEQFETAFPLGCSYVVSGSGNISAARNAGLEAALSQAVAGVGFEWLASLDDDVIVPSTWFAACVGALSDGQFNAVTGPLVKDFSLGPRWLTEEPFDQIGILAGTDGAAAFVCATGNNWISADFLRERPSLRFDPALGTSGGEDMDFFYRAVAAGLRPVFSLAASVVEPEPLSRCTFRYQVRRATWLGLLEARVSIRLGLTSRSRLLARAARRAWGRGGRQLSPEAARRRGFRYQVAIVAQAMGLAAGCTGIVIRHR